MKSKTKIILFIIIAMLFLIIKISSFSFNRTSAEITTWSTVVNNSSQGNKEFNEPYRLIFKGLDDSIDPVNSNDYRINVYVEKNTSLGLLRYLPVYKPISIESKVTYKWNWPATEQNNHLPETETGQFNISGNYNVFGLYSTEKVEQLIDALISENIRSKIQTDIKERLTPNKN